MGLISYEQLEDGFDASANLWNERFGIIFDEINGNIDQNNIKNGSITTAKIAAGAVTSDKLATSLYVDENGWTVHDMGTHKTYSYKYNISNVVISFGVRKDDLPLIDPPVGKSRTDLVYALAWYGGYAGHAIPGLENGAGSKIAVMLANQYAPANQSGTLTFNGDIYITATEKV